LREVEALTLLRQTANRRRQGCQPYAPAALYPQVGRAVAQAVRRWLPTAAAWVRLRAAFGVCGGQSGIGAGFLRVLRIPLPIIPPISPAS
jgi:hypothetical protein